MNCCQCQGIETTFNREQAEKELKGYRRNGPSRTTRILIEALQERDVEGMTLLDIGGGVGAIQHALLESGVEQAVHVDASSSYLGVAEEETARRGLADRVSHQHGDFVALAPDIEPADIVTLDRVLCCYHDMPALVAASSARARRLYGLVYPPDSWWIKLGIPVINFFLWLRRNPFRIFIHDSAAVDAAAAANGLKRTFYRRTILWQIVVYERD